MNIFNEEWLNVRLVETVFGKLLTYQVELGTDMELNNFEAGLGCDDLD